MQGGKKKKGIKLFYSVLFSSSDKSPEGKEES